MMLSRIAVQEIVSDILQVMFLQQVMAGFRVCRDFRVDAKYAIGCYSGLSEFCIEEMLTKSFRCYVINWKVANLKVDNV